MRVNWLGHLVTNWCGDWGFVRRLDVRISIPNLVGDLTTLPRPRGAARSRTDGEHLVELECWGENQRGDRNATGRPSSGCRRATARDTYAI